MQEFLVNDLKNKKFLIACILSHHLPQKSSSCSCKHSLWLRSKLECQSSVQKTHCPFLSIVSSKIILCALSPPELLHTVTKFKFNEMYPNQVFFSEFGSLCRHLLFRPLEHSKVRLWAATLFWHRKMAFTSASLRHKNLSLLTNSLHIEKIYKHIQSEVSFKAIIAGGNDSPPPILMSDPPPHCGHEPSKNECQPPSLTCHASRDPLGPSTSQEPVADMSPPMRAVFRDWILYMWNCNTKEPKWYFFNVSRLTIVKRVTLIQPVWLPFLG